jgi:hypothetical protein
MVRTGATFADAVAEYMRWLEHDRARKPTTIRGYESIMRAHLLPAFGERRLENLTSETHSTIELEVFSPEEIHAAASPASTARVPASVGARSDAERRRVGRR